MEVVKEEVGISKDQENMEEINGGSEVQKEENTDIGVCSAEIGVSSKRNRKKVNYNETLYEESEGSDGFWEKSGGIKRRKKPRVRKEANNGVDEEKKLGFEGGLVKKEEGNDSEKDSNDDFRKTKGGTKRKNKTRVRKEENNGVGEEKKLRFEEGLVKKEVDGEMGDSGSNNGETEDSHDSLNKEQKGEDNGGEKEEGNDSDKDNNNEEMSTSRTRKSSRKAKDNIQKLNPVIENCENGKNKQRKWKSLSEGEGEDRPSRGKKQPQTLAPRSRVITKDENVSRI